MIFQNQHEKKKNPSHQKHEFHVPVKSESPFRCDKCKSQEIQDPVMEGNLPGKSRWLITSGAFISMSFLGMSRTFLGTALPAIRSSLDLSLVQAGTFPACLQFGFAAAVFVGGFLSDVFPCDALILIDEEDDALCSVDQFFDLVFAKVSIKSRLFIEPVRLVDNENVKSIRLRINKRARP